MDINGLKTEKQQRKINQIKILLLKNINGIDKGLTGLTEKKEREDTNYQYQA